MNDSLTTCWTLIDQAAQGDQAERNEFSAKYYSVVRSYLETRWRRSPLVSYIDDACQEVFVECFRDDGPLTKAKRDAAGGFRAFLYGVVRNIARRFETRNKRGNTVQADEYFDKIDADETSLSRVFDRAWAVAIMQQAADRQASHATKKGENAVRRVELLRLRFRDGLPIREIAQSWDVEPALLHREYSKARKEFHQALEEVVFEQNDGVTSAEVSERCKQLVEMVR